MKRVIVYRASPDPELERISPALTATNYLRSAYSDDSTTNVLPDKLLSVYIFITIYNLAITTLLGHLVKIARFSTSFIIIIFFFRQLICNAAALKFR